jgi:hypothetical protein
MPLQNAGGGTIFISYAEGPPAKIIEYYQTTLEKAGFKVVVDTSPDGITISADDEVNYRGLYISVRKPQEVQLRISPGDHRFLERIWTDVDGAPFATRTQLIEVVSLSAAGSAKSAESLSQNMP